MKGDSTLFVVDVKFTMSQSKDGKNCDGMDRRSFLKTAASTATALALPISSLPTLCRKSNASGIWDDPRIMVVRDTGAHTGAQVNADIAQVMIDEAIRQYTGLSDLSEAYQILFPGVTTDSIIGIKINAATPTLPTSPQAVQALVNGLTKMNIGGSSFPVNNIVVWDRTDQSLTSAGYSINTGSTGVRVFSTPFLGYNSQTLNVYGSNQSPSNIITDYCDYMVNFGVLKNHVAAGVVLTMKNHYGSVNQPWWLHGGNCNPYIPSLNQLIRDELNVQETLFIVDGIFGCTTGGPMNPPDFTYDGIILGEDRVAVDAVSREILREAGCQTLNISNHIDTAALPPYNLGTADLAAIDLREVDNPSSDIDSLEVDQNGIDAILNWSTPEYTGLYKVQRSADPQFETFEDLATLPENMYIDQGVVSNETKYFYRVLKTW